MRNLATYIALSKALKKKILRNEIYTLNSWESNDLPSEPIKVRENRYDVKEIKLAAFDEILEMLEDDLHQEIRNMMDLLGMKQNMNFRQEKPDWELVNKLFDLYHETERIKYRL